MRRLFFSTKTCNICKSPATKYRQISVIDKSQGKGYMLCDSKKCDLVTLVEAGWKKIEEVNLEKK